MNIPDLTTKVQSDPDFPFTMTDVKMDDAKGSDLVSYRMKLEIMWEKDDAESIVLPACLSALRPAMLEAHLGMGALRHDRNLNCEALCSLWRCTADGGKTGILLSQKVRVSKVTLVVAEKRGIVTYLVWFSGGAEEAVEFARSIRKDMLIKVDPAQSTIPFKPREEEKPKAQKLDEIDGKSASSEREPEAMPPEPAPPTPKPTSRRRQPAAS